MRLSMYGRGVEALPDLSDPPADGMPSENVGSRLLVAIPSPAATAAVCGNARGTPGESHETRY